MNILLAIHVIITLALIGVILMQKSDGSGMGLGGNPTSNMFSARGAANLLSRATAILATLFFLNSLLMAAISRSQSGTVDKILGEAPAQPTIPTDTSN
ncbi:preprotein translocase subunit SecG [Candidatus Odyssella thessalonicensis]|uniref:preprotein translocase subunit SecG n=1 Tax=Candidatus Odyssella thessalonicensis TaxID=84647 RepID=UPI000225B8FE|nr:preprotein translocase subunit SecG [Candidatus Odyssella thessalonicensis]